MSQASIFFILSYYAREGCPSQIKLNLNYGLSKYQATGLQHTPRKQGNMVTV